MEKFLFPDCSSHVYGGGRGPSWGSYATESCAGPSYTSGSAAVGANTRHAALVCDPLHGRRYRRRLEGGNGRVGAKRRGSCGGLGPDLVPECSHGLTYHNQVEKSIGQSPSSKSQRRRSTGELVHGEACRGPWGGSNATRASRRVVTRVLTCGGLPEESRRVSGCGPPHGRR